jgi:ribosomal protein S12 methylthiotransferase accessory factor YcaO
MNSNFEQGEVDRYWPKNHALEYYKAILEGLLERIERVRMKIIELERKAP